MPQQHVVSYFIVVSSVFGRPVYFEYVLDSHLAITIFGVIEILVQKFVLRVALFNGLDRTSKFLVVLVHDRLVLVPLLVQQLRCYLHVRYRLKHLDLGVDLCVIVQDEVGHLLEPEVMGNQRVKVRRKSCHQSLVFLLHSRRQFSQNSIRLLDSGVSQPSQRHLLGIVSDFLHSVIHDVDIKDQTH